MYSALCGGYKGTNQPLSFAVFCDCYNCRSCTEKTVQFSRLSAYQKTYIFVKLLFNDIILPSHGYKSVRPRLDGFTPKG